MIKEKRCGMCGKTKPVKQFCKDKYAQDGFQHKCKACDKIYAQSDKGKIAAKRYEQSDKGKQTAKRYRQSEKRKKVLERYDQSDKGRQATKRFYRSDKGKQTRRKTNATRRTNKSQAGGSYTHVEWYNLCEFYNFHCLRCNKQFLFSELTLDHIKPISKGGSNYIWNIQPLCGKCNSKKHNKEIDYRKTLPDWINRDGPIWMQDSLF